MGWGGAVLAVALGWAFFGWRGVAVALSGTVFWLLLQFSRALRVMRVAGQSPVGLVPSAVMLHARLQKGQRLMDVVMLTRSLGKRVTETPETWAWRDESDNQVTVVLADGRVTHWTLTRPDTDANTHAEPGPSP